MRTVILVLVSLVSVSLAATPATTDSKPATIRLIDHCNGPIEPYRLGDEKMRFFAAVGKDNELDKTEFLANRTSKKPFVRSFDRWETCITFDRDRNSRIDWLEAEAYRRDLRDRMLGRYDTNKNKRLQKAERLAANQALEAGKLPWARKTRAGRGNPMALPGQGKGKADVDMQLLEKYDKDADGDLTEEEVEKAMKEIGEKHRQEMLLRYDTDNDGKLSKEERKAMFADRTEPWQVRQRQFALKHFDDDGDGELSDEESAAAKEWAKTLGAPFKDMQLRIGDRDGDGILSQKEQRQMKMEMMMMGIQLMGLRSRILDADGDGTVSADEDAEFNEKLADGFSNLFETVIQASDENKNERMDPSERQAASKAWADHMNKRFDEGDTNEDGRLDGKELTGLLVDFGKDIEVIDEEFELNPKKKTPKK
jgi:Ca2+-binding EF-hand superfamily protein